MHLYELCQTTPASPSVPEWTLGCFRRRSITFFNGVEDATTEVLWLQSRGLTADFRRRPSRVRVPSRAALRDLSLSDLLALAGIEGGFARTRWDGQLMHWSGWASFQTHAKWPEPGRLERVGSALIEHAPSGAYVEDWRFQHCGEGPLIGLSLIDERDGDSGEVLHQGGGLIICGEHAAFVRGRAHPLPEGERLEAFVRAHAHDAAAIERGFAFDAAYGRAATKRDDFVVTFATLPWREGEPLAPLEGFELARDGVLLQRIEEANRRIERRFTVDTLEREFKGNIATPAEPGAVEWLDRERETLLAIKQ